MMIFGVYKQFADGLSLTRPAMYITLIGLGFNTFANWILIYGRFGLPRLELIGAGYGTLSSRILMMILMICYIRYGRSFQAYDVRMRWNEFRVRTVKKIVGIGLPTGLQYFFEVGAFAGAALMVGWIGSAERAAHQIAIQLAAISFMVVSGVAAGSTIRVGNALGRKDQTGAQRAGLTGIFLATLIMSTSALVFYLGRYFFPVLFVEESYVIQLAAQLMVIAAFFQVFDGVQAVAVGILRGLQDVRIPTGITFLAYWGISLPLGYFLGFKWGYGLNGIWYGFVVSLLFASVALSWRFMILTGRRWKKLPSMVSAETTQVPDPSKNLQTTH